MLHAEQPAVDGADDVPGEVGVLLEVGEGLEPQGREEGGHQPCERLAGEHVRVQREGAEENRDGVVPREELFWMLAAGAGRPCISRWGFDSASMPIAQRMLAPTGLSVAEEGPAEVWSGFMYLMKKSAAIRAPFMSVTVNEPFLCSFYVNRCSNAKKL